jgi:hypothetical protein
MRTNSAPAKGGTQPGGDGFWANNFLTERHYRMRRFLFAEANAQASAASTPTPRRPCARIASASSTPHSARLAATHSGDAYE